MRFASLALILLMAAGPAGAADQADHTSNAPRQYNFDTAPLPGDPGRLALQPQGEQAGYGFCLPSYSDYRGFMALVTPGYQNTCVFKSEVKVRSCDCSTYRYKDVHSSTSRPAFQYSDGEEAQDGTSCVSFAYRPVSYSSCYDGYCTSGTYNQPYCANY